VFLGLRPSRSPNLLDLANHGDLEDSRELATSIENDGLMRLRGVPPPSIVEKAVPLQSRGAG
jgi:hypothetical protein